MTERKLTSEQIDDLFELCEFHNVHYYDVQIELVDHLASAIEALWETNPELSFEEAVFQVGEQFGIEPFTPSSYDSILPSITGLRFSRETGFEAIKDAKEKELRNKYDRLQRKYIGEFFKLPRIILTATIAILLFSVLRKTDSDLKISIYILAIFFLTLFTYIILHPREFLLNNIQGKSFLLYKQHRITKWAAFGCYFGAFNMVFSLNNMERAFGWGHWVSEFLTAIFLTLFIIGSIVHGIYLPKRIKEDFTREFPQFVKS